MATSTQRRVDAADVAAAAVGARSARLRRSSPPPSWVLGRRLGARLRELQVLADVVAAAQDEAIVRLAAIEPVVLETGELVETHRAPGHVALDAPAVVSGVLSVSAVHAERRVRDAVRRAADGPDGTATNTGLGGLHAAMAAGRLDAYRAQVVAAELEEVPAEVASGVVASLGPWFDREDATRLRRRTRRVLAAISPDLLRQRAVRARAASGLRRWVDEPGVDTWLGTFPSEDACAAWAAIDTLARQYVDDGTCEHLERARAKALTDLVTSNATVDVRVQLVAPVGAQVVEAPADHSPLDDRDLVTVHGLHAGDADLVPRGWLARSATVTAPASPVLHPTSGALTDPDDDLATDAYRPGARLAALVRARDGRCRFPAARSPPGSATSTTSSPGRWGRRAPPTSPASAAATTASSNGRGGPVRMSADGALHWTPTPARSAPPTPSTTGRSCSRHVSRSRQPPPSRRDAETGRTRRSSSASSTAVARATRDPWVPRRGAPAGADVTGHRPPSTPGARPVPRRRHPSDLTATRPRA